MPKSTSPQREHYPDVAVATKVFKRTEQLEQLLKSVERTGIETIYVADDGEEGAHQSVYDKDWEFNLEVIQLEFDAGLGAGRRAFVEHSTEEFLLVVDTDHEIPSDWWKLFEILNYHSELGGVAGIEMEDGQISGMCHDIKIKKNVLIRYSPKKSTEWESGFPIVRFDFVPNAILLRRSCLEDYMWDENYIIEKEHLDFFYGHFQTTNWEFAICPSVLFTHNETVDNSYFKFRLAEDRKLTSKRYFLSKWNLCQILRESYWLDHTPHEDPLAVKIANIFPISISTYVLELNDKFRGYKKYMQ